MLEVQENQLIKVRNPRTGEIDYSFTPTPVDELEMHCNRLREGQVKWRKLGLQGRIEVLRKWEKSLQNYKDEIMEALISDTGRLNESNREFDNISKWIGRWATIAEDVIAPQAAKPSEYTPILEMTQENVPYELVGVISPWNFPMSLSAMDMIPALLAGCAVIVKPSEVTPRFIEPIQKSIDAVPELASVLRYVTGAGDVGAQLIDEVDLIVFTGSEKTGRKVAAQAGQNLIPAFLELGGKDPAIVLASADIDSAVNGILFGSICGVGHQCFSTERIYVDEKIHDVFVKRLVEKANKIELAYKLGEGHLGPIIFDKQASIIKDQLHDAIEKNASVQCGGEIEERGNSLWMRPTVITNVNHSMSIMRDETFGPVMPVMSFKSIEEAVRLANDTLYGLSSSVFSGDEHEAYEVAQQLHAGGVSINDAGVLPFVITEAPEYSAFNCSGLGESRFGQTGLRRFIRHQLIIKKNTNEESPWWYQV
ncbi:aldehyde dehydrogenase family protein [Sporosarcina obsidiansis]|uniref:aldehyde dehydrogenase family protein n=1 Tax=Sporosarcina obsidiansis TaxID=2660748 RepID=UPI00129AA087|nr:aldehyde dehydrogenase family protein [Sporosarcina obsidiansis]